MTREQKIEAFTMRLDGATLQEIADRFGLTRERIRQILNKTVQQESVMKRARDHIVYPNISKWMEENQISLKDLTLLMGYAESVTNNNLVSRVLRGSRNMRFIDIEKILKITGMTFEEAFSKTEKKVESNSTEFIAIEREEEKEIYESNRHCKKY